MRVNVLLYRHMKKKFLHVVVLVAILAAQPFLLSTAALAQAYGESTYGGGVYNDARTDTGTDPDQPSGSGESPSTGGTSGSSQGLGRTPGAVSQTDGTTDSDNEKDDTELTDEDDRGGSSRGNDSDTGTPETVTPISEETGSNLLRWLSFGALGAALLLVIVALIAKRRRQE